MLQNAKYVIERMRQADGRAVRRICIATCWMGEYRPEMLVDERIWAEYWTRWFIDRERQHSWVVRRRCGGEVVGYLTGTADERRFHRYVPWLVPGFARRLLRRRLDGDPVDRGALWNAIRSVIRGETDMPTTVMAAYPATWHVDLLPEARGCGLGTAMLDLFIERMRQLGVPGLHAQPMSINPAIIAVLKRAEFRLVCARRLSAFEHAVKEPIKIQTWVKRL
jgi:RimJ/RimL family protein N-acetyltransferase